MSGNNSGRRIMEKVGFIGLGSLGMPMAKRLIHKGCDLTVYDIKKEQQAELIELGAKGAESSRQVAESCRLIFIAVMSEAETEDVILGEDGILSGMRPDTIIAVMGTVSPDLSKRMDVEAAKKGGSVLDTPVSRGPGAPEAGTMTIFVGGSKQDFDRCLPVLELLGKRIFHLGPVGSGAVAKLFNNLALCVNLITLAEAFTLAKSAGIDMEGAYEMMMVGSGHSHALENWFSITSGAGSKVPERFLTMHNKDLSLAVELAKDLGAELPLAEYAMTIDIAKKLEELFS